MVERKPVPEPQASALLAATAQLDQAKAEWEQAIRDALATGASYREIAALAGVSHGTIEALAKRT